MAVSISRYPHAHAGGSFDQPDDPPALALRVFGAEELLLLDIVPHVRQMLSASSSLMLSQPLGALVSLNRHTSLTRPTNDLSKNTNPIPQMTVFVLHRFSSDVEAIHIIRFHVIQTFGPTTANR